MSLVINSNENSWIRIANEFTYPDYNQILLKPTCWENVDAYQITSFADLTPSFTFRWLSVDYICSTLNEFFVDWWWSLNYVWTPWVTKGLATSGSTNNCSIITAWSLEAGLTIWKKIVWNVLVGSSSNATTQSFYVQIYLLHKDWTLTQFWTLGSQTAETRTFSNWRNYYNSSNIWWYTAEYILEYSWNWVVTQDGDYIYARIYNYSSHTMYAIFWNNWSRNDIFVQYNRSNMTFQWIKPRPIQISID